MITLLLIFFYITVSLFCYVNFDFVIESKTNLNKTFSSIFWIIFVPAYIIYKLIQSLKGVKNG